MKSKAIVLAVGEQVEKIWDARIDAVIGMILVVVVLAAGEAVGRVWTAAKAEEVQCAGSDILS